MLKIKLLLFKLKNLIIISKSKLLKKKIKSKYKDIKKNFENFIETKNFSEKWFINNFEVIHYYLPKDTTTNFSYLEIGSYEGLSALNILFNYKNAKVTAIDLWEESNVNSESIIVNFNEIEDKFNKNLEGYKYTKIKNDSVIALREILKKKNIFFDIIYIDGSHNGEDILSDAIECYKILNIGGILIFDDVVNLSRHLNIQSFTGFEKFCEIHKNIKVLYLKNIAVVKKTK